MSIGRGVRVGQAEHTTEKRQRGDSEFDIGAGNLGQLAKVSRYQHTH
jgi:hypothetical protein